MEELIVSGIQTPLIWEDRQVNLEMLTQKIAAAPPGDIILLPEMFSTGFSMRPETLAEDMQGQTVQWMQQQATYKSAVIAGSIMISEHGNYYNRFIWMEPSGKFSYYDKRHLFAYAGENAHYTPGNQRKIINYKNWRINLQVCYDLRFPVWARQTPSHDNQPEYDLLIYVANWPERRINAWKTLLQARAIENQCFVTGVNRTGTDGNGIVYTGDSMCIDPFGTLLIHETANEKIFTAQLSRQQLNETRTRFPFWKDADRFQVG